MRHVLTILLAAATLSSPSAFATIGSLTIIPSQPRYMEPVYVRLQKPPLSPYPAWYGASVSMTNNAIKVEVLGLPDLGQATFDVYLGRFPAGTYTVDAKEQVESGGPPATVQFTVPPPPPTGSYPGTRPHVEPTGLWWNSAEPGWGVSVVEGATGDIFATWFTYDASGQPTWYSLQPGRWTSQDQYEGPIYRTSGPFFRDPYNSRPVTVTQVGTGTLTFSNWNTGFLNVVIDGQRTTRNIQRQVIEQ